ncbi:hypothetical protein Q9R29_15340 [Rothia sp. ARF10]|nr:hypothetical protein [Rothia sp. ARF10]
MRRVRAGTAVTAGRVLASLSPARPDGAWFAVLAPLLGSVVVAAVILGPALSRGVVLAYDMVWSPDARLTPFATGATTPAPRAVPSDAFAWLASLVLTPQLAQKLILLAILAAASMGAVALLRELRPGASGLSVATVVVAAVWNPFVSERLVIGQWTILLGYAVLPWALRAARRSVAGVGSTYAVTVAMGVSGVGGVNSVVIVLLGVLALALVDLGRQPRRAVVTAAAALATGLVGSAAWVLPSLASQTGASRSSVAAFAPSADTPLGTWGSLLSGGAIWNVAAHPSARAVPLLAVVAAALAVGGLACFAGEVRRRDAWGLLGPVMAGAAVVVLSVSPLTEGVWTWTVTELPGGGVFRDSQKFLAAWMLAVAVGTGVAVEMIKARVRTLAPVAAVLVSGLLVALSPQLAWGVGGRLDAREVPPGYRSAADRVSDLPPGEVGLLPWSQYRRYPWNGDRVSLTLGPRIIDRPVLFDDSLPLRTGVVPGESDRAAAVTRLIDGGVAPVRALQSVGVRYVAAELDAGLPVDQRALRAAGTVVIDDPGLMVVDLASSVSEPAGSRWLTLGWGVTLLAVLVLVAVGVGRVLGRKLPVGLLRSRA